MIDIKKEKSKEEFRLEINWNPSWKSLVCFLAPITIPLIAHGIYDSISVSTYILITCFAVLGILYGVDLADKKEKGGIDNDRTIL